MLQPFLPWLEQVCEKGGSEGIRVGVISIDYLLRGAGCGCVGGCAGLTLGGASVASGTILTRIAVCGRHYGCRNGVWDGRRRGGICMGIGGCVSLIESLV
jgi:hypothetical protein